MSSIQQRWRWNGWNFTARPIQAVPRRRAGRDYFFGVIFGSRFLVRAWKKESSASAKPSKRRFALSMPNISPGCVRQLRRSVADYMIQD